MDLVNTDMHGYAVISATRAKQNREALLTMSMDLHTVPALCPNIQSIIPSPTSDKKRIYSGALRSSSHSSQRWI